MTRGPDCQVCTHDDRDEIDDLIVNGNTPLSRIAAQYRIHVDSLRNHRDRHMAGALVRLRKEAGAAGDPQSVLARLEDLYQRLVTIRDQAELAGSRNTALQASHEIRGVLADIGKINGEMADKPAVQINILESAQWQNVQQVLVAALAPYPEAGYAVAQALEVIGEIEP